MPKTLVGLFDTFGEAQNAVEDLLRYGVRREDISLVARDEHGDTSQERAIGATDTAEGAGAGAVGGSLVGGVLGLLIGTGLLVIPGIGPVLAAGPLAAAIGSTAAAIGATALGAGLGAAAGGLLGSLVGAGISEEDAQVYVEGVRRGGTLVAVAAVDHETDDVRQILVRNGAIDIESRAAEWRSAGWDAPGGRAVGGDTSIPRGDSYSIHGRSPSDPRGEPGAYDFHDDENLADADRKVVDTSYTSVDRTGEHYKGPAGFETGHEQPFDANPAQFSEFAASGEQNIRARGDLAGGSPAGQTRRRRGARIYDQAYDRAELDTARAGHPEAIPAHGDFARGQRQETAAPAEPDYARGMETGGPESHVNADRGDHPETPHHGDFARGMREEGAEPLQPDYARGQRGYEEYDADFMAHYQSMTGSGGQPYDYYRPGYQFGYDLAGDPAYHHDSWDVAEREARQRWEREARGSWEEFKQAIRYGWEKARGRA